MCGSPPVGWCRIHADVQLFKHLTFESFVPCCCFRLRMLRTSEGCNQLIFLRATNRSHLLVFPNNWKLFVVFTMFLKISEGVMLGFLPWLRACHGQRTCGFFGRMLIQNKNQSQGSLRGKHKGCKKSGFQITFDVASQKWTVGYSW